MSKIIEEKLREIMEDYNISMILFIHPELGTVQLTKDKTWYIHGRKYKKHKKGAWKEGMNIEEFKRKFDAYFLKWKKTKKVKKREKIKLEFIRNLNSEELDYYLTDFLKASTMFLDHVKEVKGDLIKTGIPTSHENMVKGLENKIYGYKLEDIYIPKTECEKK